MQKLIIAYINITMVEYDCCLSQTMICSHLGAFGKVFEGVLNDPDKNMVDVRVAIKTIKSLYIIYIHAYMYQTTRYKNYRSIIK